MLDLARNESTSALIQALYLQSHLSHHSPTKVQIMLSKWTRPSQKPRWRFAPTGGGQEQGSNVGQETFRSDAVNKAVREILQNSTGHREPGLDSVTVTFEIMRINAEDIRAAELAEHADACRLEASRHQHARLSQQYEKACAVLSQQEIECLAVIDAGTTGLTDDHWDNLVIREGVPTNVGTNAPRGGSYGFGKNAPFNLSACQTVVYTTRYVNRRAAKGREQRMMAKSQMMTHDAPDGSGHRLQHNGFYAEHKGDNTPEPIVGPDVPEPFRLAETGTGIYVIGFDEQYRRTWENDTTKAVLTQFFAAIQRGTLEVQIKGQTGTTQITADTIGILIEQMPDSEHAKHYYKALRAGTTYSTKASGRLEQIGHLNAHIVAHDNAPARAAHVNNHGMLISESKQFHTNPFSPNNGNRYRGWCMVTESANEDTEKNLRRLEPPTHDAIDCRLLDDRAEQERYRQELNEQRTQLETMLSEFMGENARNNTSNVSELAELFPDIMGNEDAQDLTWDPTETEETNNEGPDENLQVEIHGKGGRNGGSGSSDGGDSTGPRTPSARVRRQLISRCRILRPSLDTLSVQFTMPAESNEADIRIAVAGEQYQANEQAVAIANWQSHDLLTKVTRNGENLNVQSAAGSEVKLTMTLAASSQEYRSYSVVQKI